LGLLKENNVKGYHFHGVHPVSAVSPLGNVWNTKSCRA